MTTLVNRNIKISTHTLTWSVTQLMRDYIKIGKISTHTLTWSVTILLRGYLAPVSNFNSHAHVERDETIVYITTSGDISTHTLTWSVTSEIIPVSVCDAFQLTRSRGA